jgi:hypothetical protein
MPERKESAPRPAADPRLLTTETPAPPEAVRAIAALLGRAAAPRHPAPPTPLERPAVALGPGEVVHAPIERTRDHEVLVEGEQSDLIRLATREMVRMDRRAKRARRTVREALARISTPEGDDLGG